MNNCQLLTLLEVADLLRLSPHTIRSMVRKGKLAPTKICRRLLFSQSEILRLIGDPNQVISLSTDAAPGVTQVEVWNE
jgi:excisionase family DNA binding protein